MKHRWTPLESAALSLLCTWGSVSCLVTAFRLPVPETGVIGVFWLLWAVLCGILLCRRWGIFLTVPAMAAALGYACGQELLRSQLLSLPAILARIYDGGYGWGIPAFLQIEPTAVDVPLALAGMVLIHGVSRGICRRKGSAWSVFLLMVPLTACLVMTDTVPDTACLFALLLGMVLLLLTSGVRRESADQGTRLCAGVLIPVAAALSLLLILVPREGYVNTSQTLREKLLSYAERLPETLESGAITLPSFGSPRQQVNLTSLSAQPELRIPVAEVTSTQRKTVYLRGRDYDVYTGTSWMSTTEREETLAGTGEELGMVSVRLLNDQGGHPMPCYPDGELILSGGAAADVGSDREYAVACREKLLGPYPGESWLALPVQTEARAKQIVSRILTNETTTEQIAQTICDYVMSCAVYDRETRAMPGGKTDFAIWFLEEADRGYCVHFATAAAVLLRSAGIPARYVTGYRADDVGQEPVRVTSNDAHAWVEYYNYRTWTWEILDATPGELTPIPQEPEEQTAQEPVTRPTQRPQPETKPLPTAEAAVPVMEEEQPTRRFPWEVLFGVLAAAAAAGAAEGQRLIRIRLRIWRQVRGEPNDRASARWRELRLCFRLLGSTPPEELRALAEKAAFSQHSLTEEELARFSECAAASRRALRRKRWYARLVYRYWYAVI